MMRAYERLLKYVSVWTTSDEESTTIPSALRELDLAKMLVAEMQELGITDASMDEHGYVYGSIPATAGLEDRPAIGLIAHLDTAPDCSGENVHPILISDYDGKQVRLGDTEKYLTLQDFPHLSSLKGRTLITTDGTTLLGADDKAGIAEIMTVAEEILKSGEPHVKVCIGFTPDEEIGSGAELLDLEKFGAKYAYTLDGGPEGEIQFENFNASAATFKVHGINVHPGSAKDIMRNSQHIAMEIHQMLPEEERPETTEGYEGFYHLTSMTGTVEFSVLKYIIRDFDQDNIRRREAQLRKIAEEMNEKYGAGCVDLEIVSSYENMRAMIEPCMELIDYAKAACEEVGVTPDVSPIRGGTDGARLSYRGLPCPNLGTGGYAFHGVYEHITVEAMDQVVRITKRILRAFI